MLYGLAHKESEFHAQNIHKVVLMAPCFYAFFAEEDRTVEFANEGVMQY